MALLHVQEHLIQIQQSKKISDIFFWGGGGGGSNGSFQKRRLRLMFNLNLRVTLKKLNIITGHEKSIKDRLDPMLFWHGMTIFCHSVAKYSVIS